MVEKILADFFQELVGISPEKEPIPPIAANDISVINCAGCVFQREIQNSCVHTCQLIKDSVILNNTNILENCPLRIKSVNISLNRSKIKEWIIKNL